MVPPRPIQVFGLTGGLGSGKSTVAARFAARGLPVVDADVLAREAVAPGTPALGEVVAAFGAGLLREGALDRKRLAELVFSQPEQLARLEAIIHPRVQQLLRERSLALEAQGEPLMCYEVPLLFEKGLEKNLRPVVLVVVPEALQIVRARERDGSTEQAVRARLAAQWPLSEKQKLADYIIDNSGSLEQTFEATDAVLERLCAARGVDPSRYPALSRT
jgi:dephospho-CoA kinase